MKTILITGGAGFIGSNFIEYFLEKYQEYVVVNLDKLTYAGSLENLKNVENNPRYKFIKGDICDDGLVENIFRDYKISGVIHFAAESHVDNSIKNPKEFILTNIYGSYVLLNTAKNFWTNAPFSYKKEYIGARFLCVSTD
ncbi:MAG TPA: GDP-mannose 4,6-dehydratase, partial [Spirochaetota bacterium]|nr:GDP-mannose 4,6-dehydratase [Spirochaetota bacterium]